MVSKLKKNYKQWLFLGPLILFVIDYFLIISTIIEPLDVYVYHLLQHIISSDWLPIVITITNLGSFMGIIGAICVVFIFTKKIALVCLVASSIQQLLNRIIKAIVQRPRPSWTHLVTETSYSFPSGHAMAITCLYGLFVFYLYHSKLKYRKLLIVFCIVVIVAVSLSRVYLGVHYFSDVFAGAMLSLSLVMYISNIPSFCA